MATRVDLFYNTYKNFTDQVLKTVREETYGQDIGQNSWLTTDEYDRIISWLQLSPGDHVLEVASGSGGPANYLSAQTNCHVTGIDANEHGVQAANDRFSEARARLSFQVANANERLPFADESFAALLCIDSMNHFPDRLRVFREWRRVLRPGGRAVFTDPVVITGPVTHEELARRSAVGTFLFVPPGTNDQLIEEAGLKLVLKKDASENAVLIAGRWHDARERQRTALIEIEGEETFAGLQEFFASVHRLTGERRLSRIAYYVERPAGK